MTKIEFHAKFKDENNTLPLFFKMKIIFIDEKIDV